VAVIAITAGVTLMVTAGHEGPSEATQRGLRLDQPGSPPGRGVPLHLASVASRVERVRGLASRARPACGS
jgi:hypothetical protein